LNDLHRLLIESGVRVDFIRSAKLNPPQWSAPVVLEEIGHPQAALGLAANCFHLAQSAEAANNGNVLAVFSRVAKEARAYLLRHGNVAERVRHVSEAIGPPQRAAHV